MFRVFNFRSRHGLQKYFNNKISRFTVSWPLTQSILWLSGPLSQILSRTTRILLCLCAAKKESLHSYFILHTFLQEVCAQYWPMKDAVLFEEFRVNLLKETNYQNYIERKLKIVCKVNL